MREIRQSGSEGGGGREASPYPNLIPSRALHGADEVAKVESANPTGMFTSAFCPLTPPKSAARH